FPDHSSYMKSCAKNACRPVKADADGVGICIHDLAELLRGAKDFSLGFLKEERIKWHPNQLTRYYQEDHKESLKRKASLLFAMITDLIEVKKAEGWDCNVA
ncbi:hypothetical protein K469DRAFT_573140, partial [Zopfia rhizophila CBS 207.26]